MFRIFFVITITPVLIFTQNRYEKILISERIGDYIDPVERDYFVIFPLTGEFKNAFVAKDNHNNQTMLFIQYFSNGHYTDTLFINNLYFSALNNYIEDFEKILWLDRISTEAPNQNRTGWEFLRENLIDWKKLENRKSELIAFPYSAKIRIVLHDKSNIRGTLFYADNALIIINEDFHNYNWKDPLQNSLQIYASKIDSISYFEKSYLGFGTGALLGAGIGAVIGYGIGSVGMTVESGIGVGIGIGAGVTIGTLVGGTIFSYIPTGEIESEPTMLKINEGYLYRNIINNGLIYDGPLLPLELRQLDE